MEPKDVFTHHVCSGGPLVGGGGVPAYSEVVEQGIQPHVHLQGCIKCNGEKADWHFMCTFLAILLGMFKHYGANLSKQCWFHVLLCHADHAHSISLSARAAT